MEHREPVVAVIHATAATMSPVAHAFADAFPGADVWHLLDDRLVKEADRAGGLTAELEDRMNSLIDYAVDRGAEAVQLACSMYGPVATASHQPVPVFASDQAMFDAVVALAPRRIGIIASLGPSAEDSASRLGEAVSDKGQKPDIRTVVVPEAVAAAGAGDHALLAQLLGDAAVALGDVDVIVLAQYSLSPAAASVAERVSAPVLSGPHLAASRLGTELEGSRS